MTIWISNIVTHESSSIRDKINERIDAFVNLLTYLKNTNNPIDIYIISNEVGMGIVPDNPLARYFRQEAGRLNQKIASLADEVYLMISGLPVKLRSYTYEY
ncbi:Cobinamide kinase/cobinamide phosphate guanyltransferase [Candidatus Magnetoovum chiemensis]|nr:Cobinamide kinase/cobinamide phosphate guanyltransferase [Candidatus Magnetoovum chiemensis]